MAETEQPHKYQAPQQAAIIWALNQPAANLHKCNDLGRAREEKLRNNEEILDIEVGSYGHDSRNSLTLAQGP